MDYLSGAPELTRGGSNIATIFENNKGDGKNIYETKMSF